MVDVLVYPFSSARRLAALTLTVGVALGSGCGPAKEASVDTDTDGASDSSGTTGSTPGVSGAMTADTTAGMDGGVTTADPDTSPPAESDDDGGSFINMPTDGDDGGPQGLGGDCVGPDDCESGFCYQIPMIGSACSECLMDSDCETGTCALDIGAGYAVCTDGSVGVMCDSDEGCAGELICAPLIDTGGAFPTNFCSECGPDVACDGELICAPVYDAAALAGSLQCLAAGSVENGGGCPIGDAGGDGAVCSSGFCGAADIFGFVELGVCGECVVDEDCGDPKLTCTPASAGMGGLMPATCG